MNEPNEEETGIVHQDEDQINYKKLIKWASSFIDAHFYY